MRRLLVLLVASVFAVSCLPSRYDSEEDRQEEAEEVPKGIFHYTDTENSMGAKFKLPDFEAMDPVRIASDLLSSAVSADTRRKSFSGFQVPMPFGTRPMNLQINGEQHTGVSLTETTKKKPEEIRRSDMRPEARHAFNNAKETCLSESTDSCDQALDTFHQLRFGKSLLDGDQDDEDYSISSIIRSKLEKENEEEEESTEAPTPFERLRLDQKPPSPRRIVNPQSARDFLRSIN